jgi:hypothetical protein
MLIGSAALENSRRLVVYKQNSRRNYLNPKMRSKRRRDQESMSSLKNVAMLSLNNIILSMSTRT